jgi:hypothetical protein
MNKVFADDGVRERAIYRSPKFLGGWNAGLNSIESRRSADGVEFIEKMKMR